MKKNSRRTTIIVTLLVAIIALAAYAKNWQRAQAFHPEQLTATYLTEPRALSAFSLKNTNTGKAFTNASLKDHWTLLFFGFTQCNSICPTTMNLLSQTLDMMDKVHLVNKPKVAFISVDPDRDVDWIVRRYVQSFHPDIMGLRGEDKVVQQLAKELSVVYMKVAKDQKDKENYDINHSGALLLVNPREQLQAIFSPPHNPETLAKEIAIITQQVH